MNPAGPARISPGLALLFALTLAFAGCGPTGTTEERVKANIDAMEAAGETADLGAFMDFVADDFEAQDGAMGRDDFRRFMFIQFRQQRRIQAQLFPVTVEEEGPNLARARFNALVTGGGGFIPDDGQLFAIETTWVLEGGDWLLWRADWRGITP